MSNGIKREVVRVKIVGASSHLMWYAPLVGTEVNVVRSLTPGWYDLLKDIVDRGAALRHLLVQDCEVVSKNQPASDAATDEWVPHDGKTCPLPIGMLVQVRRRDGREGTMRLTWLVSHSLDTYWTWGARLTPHDVLAYKLPSWLTLQDVEAQIEPPAAGEKEAPVLPPNAHAFLDRAAALLGERGAQYDRCEGERSMGKTVAAFNAITGHRLAEHDGWLLLLVLKQVRQWTTPDKFHSDSAEDGVAYAALLAESLQNKGVSAHG